MVAKIPASIFMVPGNIYRVIQKSRNKFLYYHAHILRVKLFVPLLFNSLILAIPYTSKV